MVLQNRPFGGLDTCFEANDPVLQLCAEMFIKVAKGKRDKAACLPALPC